jgi:hypothetical protein
VTEDQIERIAEREMDRLDREYMSGVLSKYRYDKEVRALDRWVREELKKYK